MLPEIPVKSQLSGIDALIVMDSLGGHMAANRWWPYCRSRWRELERDVAVFLAWIRIPFVFKRAERGD